jgi:hypothetical protein
MEAQETVSGENLDEAAKMIAKEIFQGSRKRDRVLSREVCLKAQSPFVKRRCGHFSFSILL